MSERATNRVWVAAKVTLHELAFLGPGTLGNVDVESTNHVVSGGRITATAIKGVLRSALVETAGHLSVAKQHDFISLFGAIEQPVADPPGDARRSVGGKLRFRDVELLEQELLEQTAQKITSTAIDAESGSAEDSTLRARSYLHGTKSRAVDLRISADNLCESELKLLKELLGVVKAERVFQFGADTRFGFGVISISNVRLTMTRADDIAAWVTGNKKTCSKHQISVPRATKLQSRSKVEHASLELQFDCLVLPAGESDDPTIKTPFEDPDGNHALPSRSVNGVLRARAARICRTLNPRDNCAVLDEIFGSTRRKGALGYPPFFKRTDGTRTLDHQMVAIDRFTGGAASNKLYKFQPLLDPTFKGELTLRTQTAAHVGKLAGKGPQEGPATQLRDAAKGLLALVFRDLKEGDLQFGAGATKGYGVIRNATLDAAEDSVLRLAWEGEPPAVAWVEAFCDAMSRETADAS